MTPTPSKRSFVVSYDETTEKLSVCALKDSDLAPLRGSEVVADWPLASINYELGEDVARRLGITALSILALYHPSLKPMLKVSLQVPPLPDDTPAGQ
ncbi:hypothetical protein [Trinickia terrae]|nr:hypothetical protein [Trinickia terrae]